MLFEMMWVYILQNTESKKFYVGCTADVNARVKEHNYRREQRWTGRQQGQWQLVYKKLFSTKREALIREKAIKRKKSRRYIEQLIEFQRKPLGVVD
ncbi:MAG: GIY-YIG nuclease family protein [Candidatus Omnitrophica bacterium]|nr:GIY-YIG nuclease family protein [Candidatus Omnitrophota bacterium]